MNGWQISVSSCPKGPVHGDAHGDNLMVDHKGNAILIDFENFCCDHPEWDLMVITEYDSMGWASPADYAAFVDAYAWDLRQWSGFSTLRAIQEFKMTTWLMQNVNESADAAGEYARRIASLRDDEAPRDWNRADGVHSPPVEVIASWSRSLNCLTIGIPA